MSFHSPELAPNALRRRILRWNLKQCVWGGAILACSALLWVPTVYATLVFVSALQTLPYPAFSLPLPWSELDAIARGLAVAILLFITWLGCSKQSPLVVWENIDPRFSDIDLPDWTLNDHWNAEFLAAIPGIAPALTLWGFRILGRCFSWDRRQINLACRTYAYLKRLDDWVAYPKLLSQRQAVILLYHLKLIHISNRFGVMEIRARIRT